MRLLMATADDELRQVMRYWLGGHGFDVSLVSDGDQALHVWQIDRPELALLDAALPIVDGFTACCQMAAEAPSSLIMLMTRPGHAQEDELRALEAGAAACIGNPFSPALLLARLRALVRRAKTTATSASVGRRPADSLLKVGELALDGLRHEVTSVRGHVRLTPTESRLLQLLMTNAGQVLPTALLVERVWGYEDTLDGSALVKTHIRHLRQKVEAEPSAPRYLVTVPGCGYYFAAHAPAAASESYSQRAMQPAPAVVATSD